VIIYSEHFKRQSVAGRVMGRFIGIILKK